MVKIELGLPEDTSFLSSSPEKQNLNRSKIIDLSSRSLAQMNLSKDQKPSQNDSLENCNARTIEELPERYIDLNDADISKQPKGECLASQNWASFSLDKAFEDSCTAPSEKKERESYSFEAELVSEVQHDNFGYLTNEPSSSEFALIADMLEKDVKPNESALAPVLDSNLVVDVRSELAGRNTHDVLMNSITSMMETSLHMSWNGENEVSVTDVQALDEGPQHNKKLNMVTEQTQLPGEGLCCTENSFTCEEVVSNKDLEMSLVNGRHSSSSNDIMYDSLVFDCEAREEGSSQPLQSTPKFSDRGVRSTWGSNGEMEASMDKFDSFLRDVPMEFAHHASFEFSSGPGHLLKLKVVEDPNYLPDFSASEMVGLGFKLKSTTRSTSTPRSLIGIGNKILGRRFSLSNSAQRKASSDKGAEDSLGVGFYDGKEFWCYRWTQADPVNGRILRSGQISVNNQVKLVRIVERFAKAPMSIFDAKETMKSLRKYCATHYPLMLENTVEIYDPKIANWLLQNDDNTFLGLDQMVDMFLDESDRSLRGSNFSKEAVEAYYSFKVMQVLKKKLLEAKLWNHFREVEMPSIRPLCLMELNGFGLDTVELERIKKILEFLACVLELRAYQIAGKQFNLNSGKEVSQVLFREIGLRRPEKAKGTGRDVLSKLDHPLPRVIMEWRKVSHALKTVCPFLQERNSETKRMHGYYSHFTLTGRVIMSEPSLQCIPRDFLVDIGLDSSGIGKLRQDSHVKFGLKFTTLLSRLANNYDLFMREFGQNTELKISIRNAFVPNSGNFVLLSADYAQLELRILAHLCKDEKLMKILNNNGDVFRNIASKLNDIDESQVSDALRQEAKKIIYGIIYGMGSKTLSDHLELEEITAANYILQFMKTFPKVKGFIDSTVKLCRQQGFVETMSGRRRYLGHINSRILAERAQAERQAINSRVQGSASDLVKVAMNRIHSRLCSFDANTVQPVPWTEIYSTKQSNLNHLSVASFPILNLHDELIFEVNKSFLGEIAKEIKIQMESCVQLDIQLPVVIKTGPTWSNLSSFEFL